VGDDFGLTRAGIVFQFNNGDEQTLILKDFRKETHGPVTTAVLQEMLMVEKLAATSTDILTYYAFAEDNYPAGARRTETDLRYIDIRPFKREYKLADSADGFEGEDEFASLAELIARQRFNLNRANRLAKHKPTDKTLAEDPLKISSFEEMLVGMTRELTEGLEGIVGQRIEPLHAAEESMLAAVAALDHGQNARAPGHMGEALRNLIAARVTLQILIGRDADVRQRVRGFDRQQAQKIRKPKKDEEEAAEIAGRIEELAHEEDFVYATLAGVLMDQEAKEGEVGEPAETDREAAEPKAQESQKDARRDARERQEKVVDKARELEEKLKKLDTASDLAKLRMTKAAETAEKASGALSRGSTKAATEAAKAGAALLHELARQIKGELARDVALELAMARDLADELAEREGQLGQDPGEDGPGASASEGRGRGGRSGWDALTDAERIPRLEEAARTLEHWLKDASLRAKGATSDRVRELIEESEATRIVERMERVCELFLGGQRPEARRDARELARILEGLARQLDLLHRGIVAPELAALVEFDRRLAELTTKLKTVKTDADLDEWHRMATALIRDLEKAGLTGAAATLTAAWEAGDWHWGADHHISQFAPGGLLTALSTATRQIQEKIQDLILVLPHF
jgi:hypothetical protein